MEKKYKMKEVSGERESWEGEQKKKERNSQVWIETKQNKTKHISLCHLTESE